MTIGELLVVWVLFIICPITLLIGLIALSEWATRISVEKDMKKHLKVDLRPSREWHMENGYPVACKPSPRCRNLKHYDSANEVLYAISQARNLENPDSQSKTVADDH